MESAPARQAFDNAKSFYERPVSARLQERHRFDSRIYKNKEVMSALRKLFNNKCAYCETAIGITGEIDQFRPKAGSYDVNTKLSLDHYWWLAYDWNNLYLVCQVCNANKGSKFPVKNTRVQVPKGVQARFNADWYWKDLDKEEPLLLDPCSERINPADHLVFHQKGLVAGLTGKGKVTIETLKLNRERLVHERKRAIEETFHQLEHRRQRFTLRITESELKETLSKLLSPSQSYLAARRACIDSWLKKRIFPHLKIQLSPISYARFIKDIQRIINAEPGAATRISAAAAAITVKKSIAEQTKKEESRAALNKLEPQYITRIELHNVKTIEHLEIELSSPQENYTPWLVLLGENGMGKSSILKAVALALMDKEYLTKLKLDASQFVRHGQRSGYVKVHTTAHSKPFELSFNRTQKTFKKGNDNRLQTLLLGYGGTRLLPRGGHKPPSFTGYTRIESLFDPFLPLLSAESWLLSLDQKTFGYGARVIKDLLIQDDQTKLIRRDKAVRIKTEFNPHGVRLEDLSDGYQSMVALSTDIMRVLMKGWELAEKAHGIVMLDEIDVHLHPRWKMEVGASLRRAFPRVQFIVTTHDPLCLKGARNGEVRVLSRNGDRSELSIASADVPPGATADQLLTGFWFGLTSTIDAETLELINEHRQLMIGRQTSTLLRRRLYLEDELRRRLGVYADTSLDRMAQSAAAELMRSKQQSLTPQQRQLIRERLLRTLSRSQKTSR